MGLPEYQIAAELVDDGRVATTFLIAAMRRADSRNLILLRMAFPRLAEELQLRYDAPGGDINAAHHSTLQQYRDAEELVARDIAFSSLVMGAMLATDPNELPDLETAFPMTALDVDARRKLPDGIFDHERAPEPTPGMPKIYVFSNEVGGGDGICYAMAEDGTVLGSHWCSHEGFASGDLGVTPDTRSDRHETYAKHYSDGYDMEFVPAAQVKDHPGLSEAFRLNQEQAAAVKAETS